MGKEGVFIQIDRVKSFRRIDRRKGKMSTKISRKAEEIITKIHERN